MRERPILFSGPMVRALLDGRKTQTRRVVKPASRWADRFPICNPSGMAADHQVWFWDGKHDRVGVSMDCPYGVPGDRLWVRETWRPAEAIQPWDLDVTYAADGLTRTIKDGEFGDRDWTMPKAAARGNVTPLHMPRWASRLTLEITEVRVERLQDISAADAEAEGVREPSIGPIHVFSQGGSGVLDPEKADPLLLWQILWRFINGEDSWRANPWVWAITFRVLP